jgi:hypothetical protein
MDQQVLNIRRAVCCQNGQAIGSWYDDGCCKYPRGGPFLLPKAMSLASEKAMPKPVAPTFGLMINLIPTKIIPAATNSVIQKDADRAPHLVFSLIVFICYYLFNSTKLGNENSRFIHLG